MAARIERRLGRYRLIAAPLAGKPVARAFLAGARQGSGVVAETTGQTLEEALALLAETLIQRDAAAREARRLEDSIPLRVPTAEEYRDALACVAPSDGQWAMLRAHAAAGSKGLISRELAEAAGWTDFSAANLQYGLLGRAVADYLGITLPKREDQTETAATFMLATGAWNGPDGTFLWVIHPELAAALD